MNDDLGLEILALSHRAGVEQAEVFFQGSRDFSVEVKKQAIESIEKSRTEMISLRVIKGCRVGHSFSSRFSDAATLVSRAIENTLFSEPDEGNTLPGPATLPPVDVYDPQIADLSEVDAVGLVMRLEHSALSADRRITKVRKAGADYSVTTRRVVNSLGVDVSFESTTCSAQIMVVAEDGRDSQMAWEFGANRFLGNLSFEDIGVHAAQKALTLLNGGRAGACKASVLLSSDIAADFLSVLSPSFSYEAILRRRSLLAERQGSTIVSPLIDIVDDGLFTGEVGSRPFDAEGVPSRHTVLVEAGILRNYLHNTYTARKSGLDSTGNAVRGGPSGMPSVGVSNIYIKAAVDNGGVSLKSLIGSIEKGLLVLDTMGMHTANPVSGDFSVGAAGVWIEHGRACGPVREVVISGNLLGLFGNICMVGDDLRFYGNIGAPSLLIENVDISG